MMYSFGTDLICSLSMALVEFFICIWGVKISAHIAGQQKLLLATGFARFMSPSSNGGDQTTCFFEPIFRVMYSKPPSKKGHESIANPVKGIKSKSYIMSQDMMDLLS